MPQFTYKRSVDPGQLEGEVKFDDADYNIAFVEMNDPGNTEIEELHYEIFSPVWKGLKLSQQLTDLAKVAKLIEDASQAKGLTGTASLSPKL